MSQVKAKPKPDEPVDDSTFVDTILEYLLPATMLVHLLLAPYTKVEESFNIQAIHDVVNFGTPVPFHNAAEVLAKYDHFEFPGVVPRSFAGAQLIGGLGSVVLGFVKDGPTQQMLVRALLGLLNCSTMMLLARRVATTYSRGAARWYLLLQASQFHVMFYVSRTLPNMLAFGMVTYALAELLPPPRSLSARQNWFDTAPIGLQVLIVAAVIFRCELALLFVTSLIPLIATGWISIFELVIIGGTTSLVAIATAVSIDTFFWQSFPKPMWAELEGFIFNTLQGKSSEWGTSPIHYYFTNSIPKMMLNPFALLVLLPIGIMAGGWRRTTERIVGPALSYVAIYSLLPHKEWRFIVYVMPALTVVAGVGADWVYTNRKKSILNILLTLTLFTSVAATFAAAFGMSYISSLNYPGGQALKELEAMVGESRERINVHMDVYTCMTGATRFTQNNVKYPGWKYSKEEDKAKLANPAFWADLDYVITRSPGFVVNFFPGWEVKKPVQGYTGVAVWQKGRDDATESDVFIGGRQLAYTMLEFTGGRWPMIKMRDQVWILGRKDLGIPGFDNVKLKDEKEKRHDEL
ncbi:dolichyl-P-Man:Man(7)GlcNAc(2)-PP-dolichol alpha-1,6-mannosyltransferase [Orbilia ellipsospora]|uniref:Mannosyltransferase n=1 Tax=Orbilia ellipsospora TaxID=2528407 RepID=A0AAV9X742_9PEZI